MENLKDIFICFYEMIRPLLLIFLYVISIFVLFFALSFFSMSIDKIHLSEIRYCPNCGIDLINKY